MLFRYASIVLISLIPINTIAVNISIDGGDVVLPDIDRRHLGSSYTIALYSGMDVLDEVINDFVSLAQFCGGDLLPVLVVCGEGSELVVKKIGEAYGSCFYVQASVDPLPMIISSGYILVLFDGDGKAIYWSGGKLPSTIEEVFVSAVAPFPKAREATIGSKLQPYRLVTDEGSIDIGDMLKLAPLIIYILSPLDENLMDSLQHLQFLSEDVGDRASVLVLVDADDRAIISKLKSALKIDFDIALLSERVRESYVMNDPLPILIGVNSEGRVVSRYVYTRPPLLEDVDTILGESSEWEEIPLRVISDEVVVEEIKSGWIPCARFAGSGKDIVFNAIMGGDRADNIYGVNIESGKICKITDNDFYDLYPYPLGNDIYFFGTRSGEEEIWLKSREGGYIQIIHRAGFDECPSVDLEGSVLVFQSDFYGNFDIWICDRYGRDLKALVPHPADDIQPSLAPDSSGRVVFVSERGGSPDIWIVGVDARGLYQVTADESNELFPSFSPDGTRIVYACDSEGTYDIWLSSTDGLRRKRLTDNKGDEIAPSFSPDGKRIVYTQVTNDGDFTIKVMEVEEIVVLEEEATDIEE